jgi:hypothetical protein
MILCKDIHMASRESPLSRIYNNEEFHAATFVASFPGAVIHTTQRYLQLTHPSDRDLSSDRWVAVALRYGIIAPLNTQLYIIP